MTQSMYQDYFGISENPFSILPDPHYLFMSQRHQEALAHLLYGVGESGGFVLLTGEVGTGKTTLCRALMEQLPPGTDLALILNPKLTEIELMASICDEMRIPYPPGTDSLKAFFDFLNQHLLQAHADGRNPVLMIDEGQTLSADVLELIRLLTNLETAEKKLLQIILVGQTELSHTLAQPEHRQTAQRITARYHLNPLGMVETRAYIEHRLKIAGLNRHIFTNGAIKTVYKAARGIPRLINSICDRALLAAYVEGQKKVPGKLAKRAAGEVLGHLGQSRAHGAWRSLTLVAAILALVLVGVFDPYHWGVQERLTTLVAPLLATTDVMEPAVAREPAPEPEPEPEPEADLTGDLIQAGTQDRAFVQLFDLWKQGYLTLDGSTPCDKAASANLSCLQGTTDINGLKSMNRPVVVSFEMPDGANLYGVISTIETDGMGESITIDFGERAVSLRSPAFALRWPGDFLVLWKPADIIKRPLAFGQQGQDVVELRRLLAKAGYSADENDVEGQGSIFFGPSLREKLRLFQQNYGLAPDGIASPPTLLRITGVAGETFGASIIGRGP